MKDKLVKGVAWLGAAKIVVNILALCSTVVLARLLTPADFGLVAIVMALLAIVESVTDLSLASALIHHKNPSEDHFHTAWSLNLTRGLLIAAMFACAAPYVADYYHDSRLKEIMWVIGASIFVTGFNNPKMVVLTRDLIFWQQFVMTVSQKLAGFVVGVTLAFIFKSYWAIVGGTVASQLVGVIVTYLVVPYRPRFSYRHTREIWSFSVWLTLGKMINTINWKFDHLMIGSYLGTKSLGFYTVGDNLAAMPTREAIQPLESTLFPGFKHLVHDKIRLRNAYVSAQGVITALALPLGVGFAMVAHPLILLLMGEKWLPVVQVIQIISCVFVLQTIGSQVHPLAMALGETKVLFKRDFISFFIRLPIIIAGMFMAGLMGVVYGRAISGTISLVINMHLISKMIPLSVLSQLKGNIRSLLSVVSMAAILYCIKSLLVLESNTSGLVLELMVLCASGAISYISIHVLLWHIMSRPLGPESEALRIIKAALARIKAKLSK
ncbi:PST family polysaccharide transporter [Methylovorus glucosotrophus]|uniref:lipopolysaccharide biosynthesis protein n=1 Tax=Methylovorus glucosotrophus TaxID=266009 RepID=UPI0013311FDE|nr:lipopolysaccharide biosynthesis protein [Methylovorus glucosotrophus]KAF0843630.1 PST family polysaccharide transporter [Methylovorus glucosotrophus]